MENIITFQEMQAVFGDHVERYRKLMRSALKNRGRFKQDHGSLYPNIIMYIHYQLTLLDKTKVVPPLGVIYDVLFHYVNGQDMVPAKMGVEYLLINFNYVALFGFAKKYLDTH